jgi:hypothetical protein
MQDDREDEKPVARDSWKVAVVYMPKGEDHAPQGRFIARDLLPADVARSGGFAPAALPVSGI